mmetsp:Transcript_101338/g.285811  ORF Transcript_101338/g.285811 Transcript_101338/m.285811 type:complete len:226 (-) Transcript_101338:411-1088(-)
MTSVITASRKCASWDTTTTVALESLSHSWSQKIASRSKWFVTSSNKSRSGSAKSARASESRMRHPPDNSDTRRWRLPSLKPTRVASSVALDSPSKAPIRSSSSATAAARSPTCGVGSTTASNPSSSTNNRCMRSSPLMMRSSTVSVPGNSSCATTAARVPLAHGKTPFASCDRSNDFPTPLRPMSPYRWPWSRCILDKGINSTTFIDMWNSQSTNAPPPAWASTT